MSESNNNSLPDSKEINPQPTSQMQEENTQGINFFQLLSSTLFAAFGIQNRSNSQRDFTKGKPSQFIFAGILFTVLFVVGVILVVKMVLGSV